MTENTYISPTDRKLSDHNVNYQSISSLEKISSKKAPVDIVIEDGSTRSPKPVYSRIENISLDPFESYSSTLSPSSERGQCHHHSTDHQFHGKKLGLASLVVLSFYTVCGGPFGIEDVVRAGGPFYALIGFALIFVWAIPEAMITAELSVAMPESAGSVAWVESAFGSFWAFQKGWLSWLSGIADNALYPILFLVRFYWRFVDPSFM